MELIASEQADEGASSALVGPESAAVFASGVLSEHAALAPAMAARPTTQATREKEVSFVMWRPPASGPPKLVAWCRRDMRQDAAESEGVGDVHVHEADLRRVA